MNSMDRNQHSVYSLYYHLIKKEHPEIKDKLWKEAFWSQSYCLLTTGGVTIDVIRSYIETQGEEDGRRRENRLKKHCEKIQDLS